MDIGTRRPALDVSTRLARLQDSIRISAGPLADAVARQSADAGAAAAALWRRDPSAWSREPAVQSKIANRLGWLASPTLMAESLDRLRDCAAGVKRDGFADVVLLGMGGSSLAPEVLRSVLGAAPGWPRFHMLDSTDPAAVRASATEPARTLYILASKSGTTVEPNALAAHFRAGLEHAGLRWADHFIAITDEGTGLAERARAEGFRDLFVNPGDIGGRYSALSFFGLVPAALMGHDVAALTVWGLAMLEAARSGSAAANPAVALGLLMGAGARAGRDKLTLLLPPELGAFGLWVEQLVAESTGKEGTGVVPVAGEMPGRAADYGDDRVFVQAVMGGRTTEAPAGAPVALIEWAEPEALGAEFVRWEIATAIAGALLGINPFDEPNVQQAKDATRVLLDAYTSQGRLPVPPPEVSLPGGARLTSSKAVRGAAGARGPQRILSLVAAGDYVAVLAYLPPDAALAEALQAFRAAVRHRTGAATMFGYGPRYLHSTGQLHKGGPNTGVFILITADPEADLPIPGAPYTFGTLELAQALGDFSSLDTTGRRALHVHLPAPDAARLRNVLDILMGDPH